MSEVSKRPPIEPTRRRTTLDDPEADVDDQDFNEDELPWQLEAQAPFEAQADFGGTQASRWESSPPFAEEA